MLFTRYKVRLVLSLIALVVLSLVFGIGELWRCGRVLVGPTTVAFSPAGMNALASHGYVRVTGVRAATDRMAVVTKGKTGSAIKGAYLPLLDAADPSDESTCVLLAWDGGARDHDDLVAMQTLSGPNADEIVGFVESPFDRLDSSTQRKLAPVVRANTRNCWVIDVHRPSWLKGLGLTALGLSLPVGWLCWKSRRPIGSGW